LKEAITAAAAAVCGRGEPATAAAPSSQALAGSFQPSWLCDHAFAHRCMRSCWQACRDRRRREGHRFGSLKLIGCVERRLLPPLHTLQWECGSSRTPAVALLPMPKARRRYRNLTVWLPPHVTSAAAVPGRRLRRPSVVVAVVAAASAAAATAAFAATAAHRRHRPPLHRRPPATAAAVACPWTPLHPAPARTARSVATTLLPLLLRSPCIVFCRCVLWLN
jgi:hypothetical protein